MKKKNEEKLPEQGCGTKMPEENVTTNEVVQNENAEKETAEEKQEEEPLEEEEDSMEFHASRKDFLLFVQKLLQMMKNVVQLEKSLHEFEKDPLFDMLLDLCMAHLQEMKESDQEKDSSEENCDDDDKKSDSNDDNETVAEAFISMKVKKVKF